MAKRTLNREVLYQGLRYGPGEVETDDLPEGADEDLEAKGLYEEEATEPMESSTDPSAYYDDQTPPYPPEGELGDADLSEAPRRANDKRASLPGAEPAEEEEEEAAPKPTPPPPAQTAAPTARASRREPD